MSPVLALIIANIIWGVAPPLFKFALTNIPPFTLAFARFFFASLICIPFVHRSDFSKLTILDWIKIVFATVFGITINIAFFFLGLQKTESINAPIIASAGPVMFFIMAVLFLHEKPKLRVFMGMMLSLIGVLIIVLAPLLISNGHIQQVGKIEGNIFYIIATIGSGFAPLLLKSILRKVSPYFVTFITFFLSSFTFVPFMMSELQTWSITSLTWVGFQGVLFGVFLASAWAYYLFYYGMQKITMQEVGIFTYIDPIAAVIIAVPLLHEYPNMFFFIGSLLVFGGIYISEKRIHYHPFHKLK